MRKINLFLPLFLGSFFIPTTLDAAVFDLYKSDNNQKSDLLIASPGGHGGGGGGGGGGMNTNERKQKNLEDAIGSYEYFEVKREDAIRKGESTTEIDKKIKKWEKKIIKFDPDFFDAKEPKVLPEIAQDTIDNFDQTLDKIIKLREKIRNAEQKKDEDFFDFLEEKYADIKNLDILVSFIEGSKNETIKLFKNLDFNADEGKLKDLQKRFSLYQDNFPSIKKALDGLVKYLPKDLDDEIRGIYSTTWQIFKKFETIEIRKLNPANSDPSGFIKNKNQNK